MSSIGGKWKIGKNPLSQYMKLEEDSNTGGNPTPSREGKEPENVEEAGI